jgi:hypothetical protein
MIQRYSLGEPKANDAALLGVFPRPDANAFDVATNVKKTLTSLRWQRELRERPLRSRLTDSKAVGARADRTQARRTTEYDHPAAARLRPWRGADYLLYRS